MTNSISHYYGLGRRKTSRARVWLLAGQAHHEINGMIFKDYFPTIDMQQAVEAPLVLTSQKESYGIKAVVSGGGKRAQADAVKMGAARALLVLDAKWRKQLKDAGYLRRDPRMKERKKPGLKGARRAPQFSKR